MGNLNSYSWVGCLWLTFHHPFHTPFLSSHNEVWDWPQPGVWRERSGDWFKGDPLFLYQQLAHRWTWDTILTNGIWKEVLSWFLVVFLISSRAPQEIIVQGNVSEGLQALITLSSQMITSRTFFGEKAYWGWQSGTWHSRGWHSGETERTVN